MTSLYAIFKIIKLKKEDDEGYNEKPWIWKLFIRKEDYNIRQWIVVIILLTGLYIIIEIN